MEAATTAKVVMPEMGESVTEGTVLEWHKNEGDPVSVDEVLVEISTDKVDAEVPAPVAGTVVKLLVAEGDTVEVGQVIAEIDASGNGAGPADATDPAASNGSASDSSETQTIEVTMPAMGESVTEGTVLEWRAAVGDVLSADDVVIEISTDKVDAEVPAPASGKLLEQLVEPGQTVEVGQLLARMEIGAGASIAPQAPTNGDAPASAAPANGSAAVHDGSGPAATPVARRAAAKHGVELANVKGSGAGGKITKSDVLAANNGAASASSAQVADSATAQALKGGAAMLARYMDESREIPTATSFRTLTVTVLDGRRKELKAAEKKVSFTHLIAWAIVRAAVGMDVMTHHFAEVDGKPTRINDNSINIGLAVDVEKKDGTRTLMVPVIRNAGSLDFQEFLAAYNDLVARSRENKLTADDLTGGNITLTNPGGIGTVASVPRLMVGQGTIIATGSIGYPVGLGAIGAEIGAEKVMTMTSTYDHRIIQGAESGRFLQQIEAQLQGENEFYESVFAPLGVSIGPAPGQPQATASNSPAAQPLATTGVSADHELLQAVQAATSLVKAHRTHGHLAARLDPLGSQPEGDPALDPEPLGLTPEMMRRIPADILRTFIPGDTLADIFPQLSEVYCGSIAYEIEHISSHRQRIWLREKIESKAFVEPLPDDQKRALLLRLIQVDSFERFLHKTYLGQKQFSIEGLDMTVPMVDEAIVQAASRGAEEIVLGMAHRGRLNVLAHNFGRDYKTIFGEFEGASSLEAVTTIPQGGTGDVKYHHGFQGNYPLPDGSSVSVTLESNPSHLEYVSPVVEGAARAAQTDRKNPKPSQNTNAALPLVLHGDAAFPGQGVVAETLNLQSLDGYQVGGTLHLITNNQIGFTTEPEEGRSTRWASDLAKGFDVPIIHVNADAVESCIAAIRLAFAYREEFGHDVLIDLIGYRRFGHNEADEPAYTQPEMYEKIKQHPRSTDIYAAQLVQEGVITEQEIEVEKERVWDHLATLHKEFKREIEELQAEDQPTGEYLLDRSPSPPVDTTFPIEKLREIGEELLAVPEGFNRHRKLDPQLEKRRKALTDGTWVDWALAEMLALGSLLTEGVPIRMTGQDTERGTFSHRQLVWHDAQTGREYSPIQQLKEAKAPMELHNSPLSETAALGFEYGYATEAPESLVLWEAQFGDFVNSGQVIVDQFIASGLAKWGQTSRLTLLLPHGYEGSGPEHSSARLERFLQMAAEGNIRVAYPTTPSQYYHLLRRQGKITKQRPLVVMAPKSLLRLKQASNRLDHLAEGRFYPVLPEPRVNEEKVKRLLLCTGKVYYDLVGHPRRNDLEGVAIGRVELLYPFPEGQIRELIAKYPNLEEIAWVQEEPRNMGARAHMFPRLMQILPPEIVFGYIGRPERASTGEGYPAAHEQEQGRILRTALDLSEPVSMYPAKTPGER